MASSVSANSGAFLRIVLLLAICSLPSPAALLAQEVRASVSAETVYQGQSFVYQVRANGIKSPEAESPKLDGVKIEFLGRSLMQSIVDINGRLSQETTTTFSWRLTPANPGKLTIPATAVKSGDKSYKSRPVQVEVVAPSKSDLFSLTVKLDRDHVYPGQRFAVDLTVEMQALPEPYADTSPVSAIVPRDPPALSIPWFEDSRLPKAISALQPLDTRPWQTRDGSGFTINGMRRFRFLTFLPEPEVVAPENDEQPQRVRYTFSRRYVATKAGRYELGPASLRGALVKGIEDNRVTLERVFGVSESLVVTVDPLPLKSRPKSWIGVIGELDVRSEITPTSCRVGQPLTLTLTLEGTGALGDAFPPDLSQNEAVTNLFRVYEPTSRLTRSSRIFSYSLRPKQAGNLLFPPIDLTWFDPLREKYVTGKTSEIALNIAEGTVLAGSDIKSGDTAAPVELTSLTATSEGITANQSNLADNSVSPHSWFAAWGIIAGATLIICVGTSRKASKASEMAKARRDRLRSAETEFQDALQRLQSGDRNAGLAGIRCAVNRIAAAAAGSTDEGLTTEEVGSRLDSAGFEPQLVESTRALLEDCDAARYGAVGQQLKGIEATAKQTVARLVQAAKAMRFET